MMKVSWRPPYRMTKNKTIRKLDSFQVEVQCFSINVKPISFFRVIICSSKSQFGVKNGEIILNSILGTTNVNDRNRKLNKTGEVITQAETI